MKYIVSVVAVCALGIVLLCSPAFAVEQKGLTVRPLREQTKVVAGEQKIGKFAIKNDSAESIKVVVSVERFAVKNGTYEYEFDTPKNGWIQLRVEKEMRLSPNEEREISYDIAIPEYAPAGGYYYALLASMEVPGSSISSDLRVASLLYLTVDGDALSTASQLGGVTAPKILLEPVINYRYEAENTGNVHYVVSNVGQVSGFELRNGNKTQYTLMPGTTRTVRESIAMPLLPGIYTLTYGFTDAQEKPRAKTTTVVYIPLWSVAFMAVSLLVIAASYRAVKRRRQHSVSKASNERH